MRILAQKALGLITGKYKKERKSNMYILIINNDKEEINEIQNVIGNVFENQACIIANSEDEARELIDEKQISLAFIKIASKKDIELAKKVIKKNPVVNIICISDTKDFAYDAFLIHASGYIVKPVKKEDIIENLNHLRFQLNGMNKKRVEVQCFGKFDIFVDGTAVKFARAKSKELLAYLVDRNGTMCNNEDLLSILWEDKKPTKSLKQQFRNLIYDLNQSLKKVDSQDIIIRHNNEIGIDKEKIKCDYYDFQKGDPKALQSFRGEYMTQYSDWSGTMELNLQKYFYEE